MAETKPRNSKKKVSRLQFLKKIQRTKHSIIRKISQADPEQITEVMVAITIVLVAVLLLHKALTI